MNKLKNMLTNVYAKSIDIKRVKIEERPTDRAGKWKLEISCGGLNIEIMNLGLHYAGFSYVHVNGQLFYLRGIELFDNVEETLEYIKGFIAEIR